MGGLHRGIKIETGSLVSYISTKILRHSACRISADNLLPASPFSACSFIILVAGPGTHSSEITRDIGRVNRTWLVCAEVNCRPSDGIRKDYGGGPSRELSQNRTRRYCMSEDVINGFVIEYVGYCITLCFFPVSCLLAVHNFCFVSKISAPIMKLWEDPQKSLLRCDPAEYWISNQTHLPIRISLG